MTKSLGSRAWLLHLVIISLGVLMLYPIAWLIASSFKPSNLIFSDPSIWPSEFTLHNYVKGWAGIARNKFSTFIINSFVVCLLCVIGNLISTSLTAFAFGRMNFILKKVWFGLMMMTIMLPHHVTIIPQYVLFRNLGWIDSYFPLFVPKWLGTEAFFIFLMIQFIRGLPKDLDESAKIDGCGPWQIYARIILPLCTPALITTALFTFVWTWDDFFTQLLYLNSAKLFTVPLGLRLFLDSSGESAWGPLLAMSVVALLPALVIFFSLQKYFVEGISTTGIKG
ncbi:ABC transporter permease subunit [Paenibacillus sp. LMG 31461]|uniref:ABC transporter permease subunit n=1 Tax=Paenibacillus plantarum TaxID=2654975 RepID=A0ABX1X786_9BACL|nr:carbohydrate ABC transporter permease [Paenibacillus plantarum]NOU63976.1 ABC transporter permease subunit [Paenibacillus plantarum]